MRCTFEAISEDLPGDSWRQGFLRYWPAYRQWYLRDGGRSRPGFLTCRKALRTYMPELVPTWERLVALSGDGDLAARFLSMWAPPPYVAGCAQAVWLPESGRASSGAMPALLRNYDFAPGLLEGVWLASRWHGQRVLAMSDCLWGALDGINESGLAVSLSFGGRQAVGEGFGIPLVVRYVLELAESVGDAIAMLSRIPVHMSYTVTLLDRKAAWASVFVTPDRPAEVVHRRAVTNLQHRVEWPAHASATQAQRRQDVLSAAVQAARDPGEVLEALLRPPLYQTAYGRGHGTLYTAVYHPGESAVDMIWPGIVWRQSCARFEPGVRAIDFDLGSAGGAGDGGVPERWVLGEVGSFP